MLAGGEGERIGTGDVSGHSKHLSYYVGRENVNNARYCFSFFSWSP